MASTSRYRFMSVVGEGGFGKVYRARLETDEGFTKDVAIKILADPNPANSLLKRFRDEARILGLLRDRAIVSADPPIQIGGRWAVVMEFVDGVSLANLLHTQPIPPGVALEIVGEIARALHHAYNMEGPNGQPLQLLHRDVKPENLQVTPNGEVRLLDFGIARANFGAREYKTRRAFGGTPGYIAPERAKGDEVPAGDVYSLGVMLHEAITVVRPKTAPTVHVDRNSHRLSANVNEIPGLLPHQFADAEFLEVATFAAWMRAEDPALRPAAREVEDWCRLLRQRVSGPYLREWAEQNVPHRNDLDPDEMIGNVLTRVDAMAPHESSETFDGSVLRDTSSSLESSRTVALGAVLGTGLTLLFVVALVGLGMGGYLAFQSGVLGGSPAPPPEPTLSGALPSEPVSPPIVPSTVVPGTPETRPRPAPLPVMPSSKVIIAGDPGVRAPEPVLQPAPTMQGLPAPTPKPTRPTGKLVVRSVPSGAKVEIDGKIVHSPDGVYELTYGETHWLVLEAPDGERTLRAPINIVVNGSVSYCWNFTTNLKCEE